MRHIHKLKTEESVSHLHAFDTWTDEREVFRWLAER